jgi:hypothetical protein
MTVPGHTSHAKDVASNGRGGMAQAFKRLNKTNAGNQIQQGYKIHAHA